MNSNHANPAKSTQSQGKPQPVEQIAEQISQQVNQGLSQPPSRSQVPPATAAEEIVQ